jgi:hypothetical protein
MAAMSPRKAVPSRTTSQKGRPTAGTPAGLSTFMTGVGVPTKLVNTEERRQALDQARSNENLKKIQMMLVQGIPFLKHNRKGLIKRRVLKSTDIEGTSLLWLPTKEENVERSLFASSEAPRRVRDIVMVQAADEPDPDNPDYGGTHTLRLSAGRKAVFKSFSLHFIDRTLDLEFDSVAVFKEVFEGIKLLVLHHKMAAAQEEYALYYAEQNAKNKMAWVPTPDAQCRIYFYNLYTRETSWAPPPGAPRIELEWWEQTYKQRKTQQGPRLAGVEAEESKSGDPDGRVRGAEL